MAIVQNPVTGRTKGKFASAVFSKQYGKNTMRSKPIEVRNPKTQLQKEQRTKFALIVELARLFMGFIRISFKQVAQGMSQFNVFVKTNIANAIMGAYPDYSIDYSKLLVSKGNLTGADTPEAAAAAGHKINYTWLDNSGNGDAQATDKAVALIINTDRKAIAQDITSKTRADGALSVVVPVFWVGENVHIYFAFMTETKDKVADSVYLGSVEILA